MAENVKILRILALLVILGFGLRVTQLGAIGFAEDEMNKLDAVHAYERGDFSANSEHPMVMKMLMWASLRGVLFLAIKVPLLLLFAFIVGLAISVRHWRHVGHAFVLFMFLFWIVPYSLIGGKWLRYTLSLMPFVYMLAAVGVVGLIRWGTIRFFRTKRAGFVFAAATVAVFVGLPAWTALANRPHYALYTNALAADKAGYYFPHDEFYDDGLREAIKYVCEVAPQGATIAHETPAVARYYLGVFGRTDLNSQTISSKEFDARRAKGPVYVIVQRGRTYFENRDELDHVRAHFRRVHEVTIEGASAVEVFLDP